MTTRKFKRLRSAAAKVLAGLLVLLLLVLGLLASDGAAHRAIHRHNGNGPCAICLIAKGHLES
ncbi:MAG: hypothetical protein M1608_14970, partial [Candidatus Omnitrophica bacterium]|nr:hypothetical protein [Candidatus Omnitrophota bacterium]